VRRDGIVLLLVLLYPSLRSVSAGYETKIISNNLLLRLTELARKTPRFSDLFVRLHSGVTLDELDPIIHRVGLLTLVVLAAVNFIWLSQDDFRRGRWSIGGWTDAIG
jgi:hypothetical protein